MDCLCTGFLNFKAYHEDLFLDQYIFHKSGIDIELAFLCFSGTANVTKLIVHGLKDFSTTEIDVQVFKQQVNVKIIVPEISLQFKYWANMTVLDLMPLYGHGIMMMDFENIEISVHGGASLTEGPIINNIVLFVAVNDATFHLDGMLNNPEYSALISSILNDNFARFVNENTALISKTISPIVQDVINHYLDPKERILLKDVNLLIGQ
ncbi:hypothetical protein NQ317_018547 [Molorchus minor]|uniref:Uncharacterized protein n=1 Tax=Molorchus minor TaxID=1323400 RepID=A0ABQ9JYV7_9CUCU|nr:hypothetical protein NQ317_018547 [Molorchus minor]